MHAGYMYLEWGNFWFEGSGRASVGRGKGAGVSSSMMFSVGISNKFAGSIATVLLAQRLRVRFLVSRLLAACLVVERSPCFWALSWPLWVAYSDGGCQLTCFVVNSGKVVRYPASMVLVSVSSVGENKDAW